MKDILHRVKSTDSGFACDECGLELPPEACITDIVAEIAGLNQFVPVMPGEDSGLSCSSKAVEKARETGEQLAELELEIPEGQEIKTKSLSETERAVTRGAWNNFITMRHMTRPEGLSEDIS